MSKTYYFPDPGIDAIDIFGKDTPVCVDKDTVDWLSREWDIDLMEHMHEASPEEIERYGTSDTPMDADMMKNAVHDWLADNGYGDGSEYDDLVIDWDSAEYDDEVGHWTMSASDDDHVYTLTLIDGFIYVV